MEWPEGFGGHKEWKYQMRFSSDWGVVEGGSFRPAREVGGDVDEAKVLGYGQGERMQYWRLMTAYRGPLQPLVLD